MAGEGDSMPEVDLNDEDKEKSQETMSPPSPPIPHKSLHDALEEIDDVPLGGDEPVSSRLILQPGALPVHNESGVSTEEPLSGQMTVHISNFEKRGDGMNAYMVYLVITQVRGVGGFPRERYEVWRRFSDFLGLHEKLAEKLISRGIILPQPPEKSIVALTKTKTSEASAMRDVAAMRTRLLERYLRRLVSHPCIRSDCDVRDFLTMDMELAKATNTSALSSAGVKRMLKSVGEAFSKMAIHMEEGDRWFEQIQSQTDEQEEAVRRMHTVAEGLVVTRRELGAVGETFSKALSMLSSCEESTALARCISHLTEAEENASALWDKQANADKNELAETLSEYESLFNSLKIAFGERHRVWHQWQTAQQNISKKREQKTRLELAGKTDKAATLRAETEEAVQKADQLEGTFGRISEDIKKEVARFDSTRKRDLKEMIVKFLESLLLTQQEMLKVWQRFAPETEAIIV